MKYTPNFSRSSAYTVGLFLSLLVLSGCAGLSSSAPAKATTQPATSGNLTITPGSIDFGSVSTGASQTKAETLTNSGNSSITITNAPVSGAGFSITGLGLPLTLGAGQSANFSVVFTPQAAGTASGTISIASNASNPNLAVAVTGNAASPLQGQLSVSPASLSLGSVTIGTTGAATGTLTAMGNSVTISSASSSNSQFVLSGLTFPATIKSGQSVNFSVAYNPKSSGAAKATLTFASNAYPATTAVDVTGTGTTAVGQLSVAPGTVSVGTVTVGTSGTATGTLTATGASVTVTGMTSSDTDFTVSGLSLPATISSGQSATFSVVFSPKGSGGASGTLTFTSDASDTSLVADVTGTGTSAKGQLAITPATLNLGSVEVGSSGTASGSLTASGANVTVTSASSSNSQFALNGVSFPFTVLAGQSASFTVGFSPSTTGAASGTLTFVSNASTSTTTDALTGTGIPDPTHTVNLSWEASTSSNIVGYNVYRATFRSGCGAYAKLNSQPQPATSYGDSAVSDGQTYCYVTTAVNSSNEESAFSAVVEANIPAQ